MIKVLTARILRVPIRWMHQLTAAVLFAIFIVAAAAQTTTSTLEGQVQDPQGAVIPRAEILVVNTATGQTFKTVSDEHGHWVFAAMPTATYRVTVSAPGFRKTSIEDAKIDVGIPATVNATLEVGSMTESVEVLGGAEVLQTTSATVASNLSGTQVHDLPLQSRNALDLIVTQAGTQTVGGPRNSTINGLTQSTLNVTLDGINIQDNINKNGSGSFFTFVSPRTDAVEEVSFTTSAAGADSISEGAGQIKFVTRSGTNQFHGGTFWQTRNTWFDSNYYFNTINRLPRDRIILNQGGGHLGGPLRRNKVFFFLNYEVSRLPQGRSASATVTTTDAQNGFYTYKDSGGKLQRFNVYDLAATRNASLPATIRPFAITPDPLVAKTLSQMSQAATPSNGTLRDRVTTNNDYNTNSFTFQYPESASSTYPTLRMDANLTSKHQLELVGNYDKISTLPDGLNNVTPILPGSGIVLGSTEQTGQRSNRYNLVAAVRSAWTSHLTSEIRSGFVAGPVLFTEGTVPALFAPWRGYAPTLNFATSPYTSNSQTRRNSPVKQSSASLSWSRTGHLVNFGGSFTDVSEWSQSQGSQIIPRVSFQLSSTDPVHFGSTDAFDLGSLPGSTQAQRDSAASLYAMLTGRVGSITRSLALDEISHTYANVPSVDRVRQREYGLFVQDSWRLRSTLTLNYGVRFEHQFPFQSLNGTYTRPGYAGLFGVSGVGNLFKPGTLTGSVPQLFPVGSSDVTGYPPAKSVSPTFGAAWVLPQVTGPLGWLIGKNGHSVLRGGFAISTTRGELAGGITNVWGQNQGRSITTTVDPNNNAPEVFGPPGSVLFRDPSLPIRNVSTTPGYPLAVATGNSLYDYDPNLKGRQVQSWNIGLQRELSHSTVMEIRYVGNRSLRLWTTFNLNEINIVENGFLDEFKVAQNNLAIANGVTLAQLATIPSTTLKTNYGNAGLPGQRDIPIIQKGLNSTTDSTTANRLQRGQAGNLANTIANTAADMTRLTAAGYPANLFIVNPTTGGSSVNLTTNNGGTTYNSLQVEVRRRMSAGLLVQGSYVWSHSLSTQNLNTLRNLGTDGYTLPSAFDLRHAFKLNWVYDLPFGQGRRVLAGTQNPVMRRIVEGWSLNGVMRVQSGPATSLTSGRGTFTNGDSGVVLYNMTASQLQDMIHIRKTTDANGNGQLFWLPQSLIDNTNAAFEVNNKAQKDLDPTKPYIGPPQTPGQLGYQVYVYGPWFSKLDVSLVKRTRIHERHEIELRTQALNALNHTSFNLGGGGANGATFGQTTSAYRDINTTADPGGRIIEFVLRYNF